MSDYSRATAQAFFELRNRAERRPTSLTDAAQSGPETAERKSTSFEGGFMRVARSTHFVSLICFAPVFYCKFPTFRFDIF